MGVEEITPTDTRTEKTNTDAVDVREKRIKSEEELYPELADRFRNKSLVERITEIREYIFGSYGNIKGDTITEVRNRNANAGGFSFVEPKYVGSNFFPALVRRIDGLYDYLLTSSDIEKGEQFDRLIRFSAVVYSLGVSLHPYVDANGQTFRIAALSYLSEILDRKFSLPHDSKIRKTVPTGIIDDLPKKQPIGDKERRRIINTAYEDLSDSLKRVVQLRYKNPTQIEGLDTESKRKLLKVDGNNHIEIKNLKQELALSHPEWAEYINYILEIKAEFPQHNFTSLEQIYEYPFSLKIPGYDDATSNIFTHSKEEQISKLRKYLDFVLKDDAGNAMLSEYINTGNISPNSHEHTDFAYHLLKVLSSAASQVYHLAEVDDTILQLRSKVPAYILRDVLYGKSRLLRRLRYAVINAIGQLGN